MSKVMELASTTVCIQCLTVFVFAYNSLINPLFLPATPGLKILIIWACVSRGHTG